MSEPGRLSTRRSAHDHPGYSLDEVPGDRRRVRHAPVVTDRALRGIVSIGDVVKNRIDELETERAHLTDYITGTR
jgi:CBS domain-containing protein